MESCSLTSPCGYGFWWNFSTLDSLLKLATYIQNGFLHGKHTTAVFFDLEKTYNTTWRKGVLWEMYTLGFKGNLPIFIKNFFNGQLKVKVRLVFSTLKEKERCSSVHCFERHAVFNIHKQLSGYVQIRRSSIQCSLFADNAALYFSAINLNPAIQKVQDVVNLASHWERIHGFIFSTSKTVAVHFLRRLLEFLFHRT